MQHKMAMRILNNDFDRWVKKCVRHTERVEKLRIRCRTNCNYCCNLLVSASVSEAMYIAQKLGIDQIRPLVPELVKDSKALADPSMTLTRWTNRWVPCHLLKNNLCSAYEARPFSCRSHVSFSAPEDCNDPNGQTLMLEAAHELCAQFTHHMERQNMPVAMAPLQYQLLLMVYLEDHPNTEAEWERLKDTAALDLNKSLIAWHHLDDASPSDTTCLVEPIWEHFETKSTQRV
jgi:Fe-S-cluster containining protein